MPVIIIDGPEKAGKTTTINSLVSRLTTIGVQAERVHWGPVSPDDRAYSKTLQEHASDMRKVWVWDRGWPSEYVYGRLLGRDRRMALDPWIGEWLHGRAVQANGLRVILTGPGLDTLLRLRDTTDLPVHADLEQALYAEYGVKFGWHVIQNEHTAESLDLVVTDIIHKLFNDNELSVGEPPRPESVGYLPPRWAGPNNAKVVVVGESLSKSVIPGGWLPFTSRLTIMLGREFGDDAFKVAWTNADTCDPRLLMRRDTVITCGEVAERWFQDNVWNVEGERPSRLVSIPHPAYMYRYTNERTERQVEIVRQVVQSLKPL